MFFLLFSLFFTLFLFCTRGLPMGACAPLRTFFFDFFTGRVDPCSFFYALHMLSYCAFYTHVIPVSFLRWFSSFLASKKKEFFWSFVFIFLQREMGSILAFLILTGIDSLKRKKGQKKNCIYLFGKACLPNAKESILSQFFGKFSPIHIMYIYTYT